jgi:hypothetical protein
MNRREVIFSGLAVAAGGLFGGCNASNVWKDIQTYVPVGIAAFESILTLVAPLQAPGVDAIAELVKAAFAVLAGAIDQYIAAPAASKSTLIEKVSLALADVIANLQKFAAAVDIGINPIVSLALNLLTLILSTLNGFLGQLPSTPESNARLAGPKKLKITPVFRNKKEFIKEFNDEVEQNGHPELTIH